MSVAPFPHNNLTKRKVVFLSRLFVPHIGGVETHVSRLSKELLRRGYEITIVTEQHDVSLPLSEFVDGIHVYRIPHVLCGEKITTWIWMLIHIDLFLNADVIHAHDVFWWYIPLRFILPLKPIYTTFHGYEGSGEPTRKAIRSRKISERLSKGTICIGEWMRLWYGTKPDIVLYGAASVRPSTLVKENSAVFIGRLAEDTGVLEYVDAVVKLKGKVTLDIFGEGELLTKLLPRIQKYPYIRYVGVTKTPETVYKDYRFAFVSRYLSMVEAMQCGRSVFSHWNNSIKHDYLLAFPEIEHAFMFSTSSELAQQLQQILTTLDMEKLNVKNAQEWAKQQTWPKIADAYEELWTK